MGRVSPLSSRGETSWRQTLLVPPGQVTVRLDLGWDAVHQVGMFAGEAFVSGTHELLALEVHPIAQYPSIHRWLHEAQRWQGQIVEDLFDPDPFP